MEFFDEDLITLDYILEHLSEEEIFEEYLYPVNFSKKYTNPFRIDKHPDCTYYVSAKGVLYFVDNAWGKKHYNCFGACMAYYNCTFNQSLKHIYNDLILGKGKDDVSIDLASRRKERAVHHVSDIKIKVKPFTKKELEFWNVGGVFITEKELNSKGIYSVKTLWENTWVSEHLNMVFAYIEDGAITQIYYPLRKKGQRRFINVGGFLIGNLNSIPENDEILVITKSKKDCFFLEQFGINSIYTVNEAITIDPTVFRGIEKRFKYIFTLMDKDRTGFRSAIRHKWEYNIPHLFVPEGKDFTSYLGIVGYQEVIDVINNFKESI